MASNCEYSRSRKIKEFQAEKVLLEQQVQDLKVKCESVEKREIERRSIEEKKHAEEIAFLKKTNVQLKVHPTHSKRLMHS